jgi:hypothetical protein
MDVTRASEGSEGTVGLEQGFLQDICGIIGIPREGVGQGVQATQRRVDEDLEGSLVPVQGSAHQVHLLWGGGHEGRPLLA